MEEMGGYYKKSVGFRIIISVTLGISFPRSVLPVLARSLLHDVVLHRS